MGTYTELLKISQENAKPKKPRKSSSLKKKSPTPTNAPEEKQSNNIESNIASKQAINIASNIAIFQEDIQALRDTATTQRTFRLTQEEIDWLVDTSYELSKGFKRGKVSQVDILRVGLKLFKNTLPKNKDELIKLLEEIK